jgi:hypothetical protein
MEINYVRVRKKIMYWLLAVYACPIKILWIGLLCIDWRTKVRIDELIYHP